LKKGAVDYVWSWEDQVGLWQQKTTRDIVLESEATMARISKELIERLDGKASLTPRHAIVVRVASFTFRFATVERLRECIRYYEQKTRPTSRVAAKTLEAELGEDWRKLRGWEVERWFERLPMYLLEEPKRQKVLKALSRALALVEAKKL
jgi:hypothetical protein